MRAKTIVHWAAFCIFAFIFARAGIAKIVENPPMMEGMAALGFDRGWTLLIGTAETLGFAALLAGLWKPPLRRAAILALLPFAIGAFTVHMSHHDGFWDYYESLLVCLLPLLILGTDSHFKISLNHAELSQSARFADVER